jgi:membrane protein implicated in regulation of membrane protease activity
MTWETFYLFCFVIGFLMSAVSFLVGAGHAHIPHVHFPHVHAGHAHHVGTGAGHGGRSASSVFNFATITAFLAWFGGTGYLITKYSSLWYLFALMIATAAGVAGGAIVFWFLVKLLMGHDRELRDADYEMVGTIGHVSSGIRANGTGEIVYSQEGVRSCCGARSETGAPIAKGVEVAVTRYEKGIAYVRPWEELAGLESDQAESAGPESR